MCKHRYKSPYLDTFPDAMALRRHLLKRAEKEAGIFSLQYINCLIELAETYSGNEYKKAEAVYLRALEIYPQISNLTDREHIFILTLLDWFYSRRKRWPKTARLETKIDEIYKQYPRAAHFFPHPEIKTENPPTRLMFMGI